MKQLPPIPRIPFIFIICLVIFAAFVSTYTDNTEIYSIEDIIELGSFFNPAALRLIAQEQTENTLSNMEEFFGSQNTMVLNIKLKNFEDAERDLEEYQRALRSFDNLVIKLDMSKSEVAAFQKENREQLRRLEETLNSSISYDELSKLTVEYQDDEGTMYALTYEGEIIKEKMKQLFQEYTSSEDEMSEIAERLEINTTEGDESVSILQEIVKEIEQKQEELLRTIKTPAQQSSGLGEGTGEGTGNGTATLPLRLTPPDTSGTLSLTINPDIGTYGDILTASGSYQKISLPGSRTVYLMIDTRAYTAFHPQTDGSFSLPVSAGDISSGMHSSYVRSGNDYSPVRLFTITEAPGTLTLAGERIEGGIVVNGTLIAGENDPVTGATIQIYRDDEPVTETETNGSGQYECAFTDDGAPHILQAFFSDSSIPVAECRSLPVEVPSAGEIPILFLVLALVLLVGSGSLLMKGRAGPLRDVMKTNGFFNGKQKEEQEHSAEERPTEDSEERVAAPVPESPPLSPQARSFIEEIEADFREAIEQGHHAEAARLLSDALFITAGNARGIRLHTTLTVRERAALLGREDEKMLRPFLTLFEITVYGEKPLSPENATTLCNEWRTNMKRYGAT